MQKQRGYTLVELIIVIAIAAICGIVITGAGAIFAGNFWFDKDSVLRELRLAHPKVSEIMKTERNAFALSVITVTEDGAQRTYCLNSNIFWNYTFNDCAK